jgi:etoposide-induced 2.4 mRNA
MNGLLILGSIALFNVAFLPGTRLLGHLVVGAFAYEHEWRNDDVVQQSERLLSAALFVLYQVFWIVPLFAISLLMNTIWYSKITNASFELKHGQPASTPIKASARDAIYRIFMVFFFILHTSVLHEVLPAVGKPLSFVLICFINALYSFEGPWSLQGVSLDHQLAFFESYWPYFMGFGTPIALVSSFWSTLVGLAVFAIFFPSTIIQATCSDWSRPGNILNGSVKVGHGPPRLPVFGASTACANFLIKRLSVTQKR